MRLLVLGGTAFLSRAVATEAVRRGHEVTCACRGTSGPLPEGVRHLPVDRAEPLSEEVAAEFAAHEAIVDVARLPSYVRRAVAAAPQAHWVFVSSVSAYADHATPGGRPGTLPLLPALFDDLDPRSSPETYGGMKVGCEQLVADGAAGSTIVRPGLVVGPEDPSGRFAYWPARMDRVPEAPEVLAPGNPDDPMQVIDVRDLAGWLVDLAERRHDGVFDGVGESLPMARLLAEVAGGCEADPRWTWVPQDVLTAQGVEPWAGHRSIPLWLPRPEYDGMRSHDARPSIDAGLRLRPVSETAGDTLAWLRATPDAAVTGLTPAEEAEVLAAVSR